MLDASGAQAGLAGNRRIAPRLRSIATHTLLLHGVALVVEPVVWILDVSVSPGNAHGDTIGDAFTFAHFATVLAGESFWTWTQNSFIVSVGTTGLGLSFAVPAGYAFSRFNFSGRKVSMFAFIVIQMFPGVIILVPYFMVMKTLGLLNTSLGLILAYSVTALPLCVWMLKGFFDTVPREIARRVDEAAKMLGLTGELAKKPKELSGGQRQRVAIGRALVRRLEVLLMDEPLSNLDAKLRGQMRIELRRLHETHGTTTIYVTHDQVEAMTLADRIAIMNRGKPQQHAAPLEAYANPSNPFVATFLGTPPMNLIPGEASVGRFKCQGLDFELPEHLRSWEGPCAFGIRPEELLIDETGTEAEILGIERLGGESIYHLRVANIELKALWRGEPQRPLRISVKSAAARMFPS